MTTTRPLIDQRRTGSPADLSTEQGGSTLLDRVSARPPPAARLPRFHASEPNLRVGMSSPCRRIHSPYSVPHRRGHPRAPLYRRDGARGRPPHYFPVNTGADPYSDRKLICPYDERTCYGGQQEASSDLVSFISSPLPDNYSPFSVCR